MREIEEQLDLGQEIITATQEVFSSMLMVEVAGEVVPGAGRGEISANLSSMIGLGGGVRGVLAVHCPGLVAREITGGFLGMPVEELDEDVKDAIGEIANMVAGNLKVAFGGCGVDIELAIPSSVIGESIRVSGIVGAKRHLVVFHHESGPFWIELLYVSS